MNRPKVEANPVACLDLPAIDLDPDRIHQRISEPRT
jgi:hypothetical protein